MRENLLHENVLIKIVTVDDSKKVYNDKVEIEVQPLPADLKLSNLGEMQEFL